MVVDAKRCHNLTKQKAEAFDAGGPSEDLHARKLEPQTIASENDKVGDSSCTLKYGNGTTAITDPT